MSWSSRSHWSLWPLRLEDGCKREKTNHESGFRTVSFWATHTHTHTHLTLTHVSVGCVYKRQVQGWRQEEDEEEEGEEEEEEGGFLPYIGTLPLRLPGDDVNDGVL